MSTLRRWVTVLIACLFTTDTPLTLDECDEWNRRV